MITGKFKVGALYSLNEPYYFGKVLEVIRVKDFGVTFEDANEEVSNRLSTKVKMFFGVPALEHYTEAGLLVRHDKETT